MQEYLKPLIGNAVTPKVGGALSYGVEYLICGKKSDEENLKGTVRKLLLLREVMNFLYLQGDHAKQAEALSAASAIAGITGNPAIISGKAGDFGGLGICGVHIRRKGAAEWREGAAYKKCVPMEVKP